MIVRPVRQQDLDALLKLARSAGTGLTSLPADQNRLAQRVEAAEASFAGRLPREEADYLFVLEDAQHSKVVGMCGIEATVGSHEPWYNYRVGLSVSASSALGVTSRLPILFMSNDLCGRAELCSLFLHPDHRRGLNGRLLSKSRFLFLAEFLDHFGERLIAEMRGASDERGISPFWESLGRHFYAMDFSAADYLTGTGERSFIAELMPRLPIYTFMLSAQAQAVIGKVHPHTAPALKMLEEEGLRYSGYVDIFDAGPVLEGDIAGLRSVRESITVPLKVGSAGEDAAPWLLHNRRFADCRITAASAKLEQGSLVVDATTALELALDDGASVRAVELFDRR